MKCSLVTNVLVTLVIIWQIIYYIIAVASMGGHYSSFGGVMYQVISLLPALVLGCYQTCLTIMTTRKSPWADKLWKIYKPFVGVAIVYVTLVGYTTFAFIYVSLPSNNH